MYLDAAKPGTSTTRLPYSLSQPNEGKSAGLPSTTVVGATATSALAGASAGAGANVGAVRQPAGCTTQSMGSWWMSTELVSRWMRSCSKPMTSDHHGLACVMTAPPSGDGSGMRAMASSTTRLTVSRNAMASATSGHAKSSSCMASMSSHDISSTPVSNSFWNHGCTWSTRPAWRGAGGGGGGGGGAVFVETRVTMRSASGAARLWREPVPCGTRIGRGTRAAHRARPCHAWACLSRELMPRAQRQPCRAQRAARRVTSHTHARGRPGFRPPRNPTRTWCILLMYSAAGCAK